MSFVDMTPSFLVYLVLPRSTTEQANVYATQLRQLLTVTLTDGDPRLDVKAVEDLSCLPDLQRLSCLP